MNKVSLGAGQAGDSKPRISNDQRACSRRNISMLTMIDSLGIGAMGMKAEGWSGGKWGFMCLIKGRSR